MGWVTYDKNGHMVKYYKKPGPAKAAVTRYRKEAQHYRNIYPQIEGCCTYKDFEGILMGLRGDALKMWLFCNK